MGKLNIIDAVGRWIGVFGSETEKSLGCD